MKPLQFKSTLLPYPTIKLEITKTNLKTSPLVIYSVFFLFLMYSNKLYASALRVGGTKLLIVFMKTFPDYRGEKKYDNCFLHKNKH